MVSAPLSLSVCVPKLLKLGNQNKIFEMCQTDSFLLCAGIFFFNCNPLSQSSLLFISFPQLSFLEVFKSDYCILKGQTVPRAFLTLGCGLHLQRCMYSPWLGDKHFVEDRQWHTQSSFAFPWKGEAKRCW